MKAANGVFTNEVISRLKLIKIRYEKPVSSDYVGERASFNLAHTRQTIQNVSFGFYRGGVYNTKCNF